MRSKPQRERAVVVGNCQARALGLALEASDSFTARFDLISFPAVHEISEAMVPELHRAVASASVVVPQLVDESYRNGIGLDTKTLASLAVNARVISWPNIYWGGYFPELCYLRDATGRQLLDGPAHYHDRTVLAAFSEGLGAAEVCRMLADPERSSHAVSWVANATAELQRREAGCDIHVASFIASNYTKKLLFFTMNHPSNRMLGFVAAQVLERLGIQNDLDLHRIGRRRKLRRYNEILGHTFFPLHANHARALMLELDQLIAGRARYRIDGRILEPVDAIRAFFNYYEANRRVVEFNVQQTKHKPIIN